MARPVWTGSISVPEPKADALDLMEALEASAQPAKAGRAKRSEKRRGGRARKSA